MHCFFSCYCVIVICITRAIQSLEQQKGTQMIMITDGNMNELIIDRNTGRLYKRELTREEKGYLILSRDDDADTKLNRMRDLGFDLEEILEMAMSFKE
jgi:hypothetical protein